MPSIRQLSFSGGELSSDLRGRSDLAKHASGLAVCRNFFISRRGAAVSRPGTTYVATAKSNGPHPIRLEHFVFSDGQSFALEFGDTSVGGTGTGYIRFFQNGGVVLSGGVPYEVATTYKAGDLFQLKFAQQGNTITITHSAYPPKELKRVTNTNWTLANVAFTVPSSIIGGVALFSVTGPASGSGVPGAWNVATNYVNGSVVSNGGHAWVSTSGVAGGPYNVGNTPGASNPYWVQNDTLLGRRWIWGVSALVQLTTGAIVETSALVFDPGGALVVSPSNPVTVTSARGPASIANPVWGFKIYRGLYNGSGTNTPLGYVGTQTDDGDFVDDGETPDFTQLPPTGSNPFVSTTPGSGTIIFHHIIPPPTTTDYPSCACYFEQRRVFARTPGRPAYLFASGVANYTGFDQALYPTDSSPITLEIASRNFLEVRSLLGFQEMLAFCNNGVWSVGGPGGQPMTPSGISAKEQTELGASWLSPLQIQDAALYARSKGTGVRELIFNALQSKFSVIDMSVFSEHLFSGYSITDWAYAEDPWSVVWAVRSDGSLLSLTYLREQEVAAWARHDTQGSYESVCSVPNGTVDDVYFAVARTVGGSTVRFIERQTNRVFTPSSDVKQCICLDAAAQYNGSPATTISGLGYLEGCTVYGLADGEVVGPLVVSGGQVTLTTAAGVVTIGLSYTPQLQRLPVAMQQVELRNKTKTVAKVAFEVDNSRGLLVGQDFAHLDDWNPRQVSDAFGAPALATTLVNMPVQSMYDYDGSACLQQGYPLPVTVTGITIDLKVSPDD